MSLQDKQVLGTWNVNGKPLVARTFDSGTTFVIVQKEDEDTFILREESILDRDDVTLATGLDVAATKLALLDLVWPAGYADGPQGLGYNTYPTNFPTPEGYAQIQLDFQTKAYRKANSNPSSQTVAASQEAAAAKEGWFKRNLKWVIGGVVVAVAGAVAYFASKK